MIDFYAFMLPYIAIAQEYGQRIWLIIEPYYNKYYSSDMNQILFGVVLLLFGGQFAMVITVHTWPPRGHAHNHALLARFASLALRACARA